MFTTKKLQLGRLASRRPVAHRTFGVVAVGLTILCARGTVHAAGERDAEIDTAMRLAPAARVDALTSEQLEHIRDLRRSYGLSDDEGFVRSLYAAPEGVTAVQSATDVLAGLAVASHELPAVRHRAQLEWQAPAADDWASKALGRRHYAGTAISGGEVVVYCAACGSAERERGALANAGLPSPLAESVRLSPVRHSLRTLAKLEKRVASTLRHDRLRVSGTALDVTGNRVEVDADPSDVDAVSQALQRFGSDAIAVIPTLGERMLSGVYKTDPFIYALVEGGQALGTSASGSQHSPICTSGFAITNGYGPFMLTAGHCGSLGQTWYQGGAKLGTLKADSDNGSFDAAAISTFGVRNLYGRFHHTFNDYGAPVTFAVTDHNLVGQTVCQAGMTTTGNTGDWNLSARCGVVSTMSFRPNISGHTYNATYGRANYLSCTGDSGGSVVWPTIYGYGGAGLVQSGAVTFSAIDAWGRTAYCGYDSAFSRLSVILSAWGAKLQPF